MNFNLLVLLNALALLLLSGIQAIVVLRYCRWMRSIQGTDPARTPVANFQTITPQNSSLETVPAPFVPAPFVPAPFVPAPFVPAPCDSPTFNFPACDVLLCMRGADPGLEDTLRSHLNQTYPHYCLHFILDSPKDPAFSIVQKLSKVHEDRIQIHWIDTAPDTASLKCLGLAQVTEKLLASQSPPKYFAFADSDGIVSRDWLSRLLQPIQDDSQDVVCATTGNRWYQVDSGQSADKVNKSPTSPSKQRWVHFATQLGTEIRQLWNLGSLPQMHLYRIAWGGSWAISAAHLQTCGLIASWKNSLFEDTMIQGHLHKIRKRIQTVPGLYVISRDRVELPAARRWISRQLLDLRLYHSAFPAVLFHATSTFSLNLLALTLITIAGISQDWQKIGLLLLAMSVYQTAYLWMWNAIVSTANYCIDQLEFNVNDSREIDIKGSIQRSVGDPPSTQRAAAVPYYAFKLIALTVTQLTYPLAATLACFQKQVHWRGINYRIKGSGKIQRQDYQPYQPMVDRDSDLQL